MNRWVAKTSFNWLRKALAVYRLLEDGETVIVGFSGGADSLCLLDLLDRYNRRRRRRWSLVPVHIDPGFPTGRPDAVARLLARFELPAEVVRVDVPARLQPRRTSPCRTCSYLRRRELFRLARQRGIRTIALAHHKEDVIETFLLNLLYTRRAATCTARQEFFRGRVRIVRPLYFFDKELVMRYLDDAGLVPVDRPCPYGQESARQEVRDFLVRLYRRDPHIRDNIFGSIRRLNLDIAVPEVGRS